MSDEAFRNYLGVMSFLLAALAFLANERRESIGALHSRSNVRQWERVVALFTVGLLFVAALSLVLTALPALGATSLGLSDVLRLDSSIREAFVIGWVLLVAITLAIAALGVRAWKVKVKATPKPAPKNAK